MAVIHLQLDVDSEVQPELHALLSGIGSAGSREERLRQLAASGLVWEQLRIDHQAAHRVHDGHANQAGAAARATPPPQPPLDPHAYDTFLSELRNAVRELPVLTEVLTDEPGPAPNGGAPRTDHGSAAVLLPSPPPPPSRRARLQRMKEKGLFRNE